MNEVFPKKFGKHFFANIPESDVGKQDRRGVVICIYGQAKQCLCFRPDKVELLDRIYESPKYYSGYVLFD
jgi:hypothetical protein